MDAIYWYNSPGLSVNPGSIDIRNRFLCRDWKCLSVDYGVTIDWYFQILGCLFCRGWLRLLLNNRIFLFFNFFSHVPKHPFLYLFKSPLRLLFKFGLPFSFCLGFESRLVDGIIHYWCSIVRISISLLFILSGLAGTHRCLIVIPIRCFAIV